VADELVARGKAIVKIRLPKRGGPPYREFAEARRKFDRALNAFLNDARKNNNPRLGESLTAVHDSFEELAELAPPVYFLDPPPTVSLSCSSINPEPGSLLVLTASTTAPFDARKQKFVWTLSGGRIVSGPGTPILTIDTTGQAGQKIVVKVEVDNDGDGHTMTAGCVIQIAANKQTERSPAVMSQSPEFSEPWKNPKIALALDPYEGNDINWEQLATDPRVVAIIHRATIGDRADRKYTERRVEAKKRGYKWGAYHLGKPGDPIKQADFFLATVKPEADELMALDLESTDGTKHMSLAEACIFIKRIQDKSGRYPMIYANHEVTKAISDQYGTDNVFSKTPLWYARFKRNVSDFPSATWKTYTVWQFSSEQNCSPADRTVCLYTVPGTEYDMDVDVYNGTIEELRSRWPFVR
jgi:GH25 family lysozyme M1 (1,4-beta-N-acetylmuramidase)